MIERRIGLFQIVFKLYFIPRTDSSVGWASGCRVFNSGQTNTQGLKITE